MTHIDVLFCFIVCPVIFMTGMGSLTYVIYARSKK